MKAASHASTYSGAAACARENQPSDPRGRSLRSLRCDPRRARENLAQFRRPRRGEGARGIDPFDGVDLVAQARFASRPARNERGDDEMRSYSCPFGKNRLHMAVKSDDFGFDSDLFHEFPGERGGERLSHFDPAAWQTEMAQQRRPRAADDERPPTSKHRRRDREDWAAGKQPVIHEQIYPAIASARARSVWEETRLQDRARQFQKTIDALCEGCAPERLPSWPGLTRLVPAIHAAPSQRQGRHCRNQERRLTERGSPAVSPFLSFVAPNRVNGRGQARPRRLLLHSQVLPNSAFPRPAPIALRAGTLALKALGVGGDRILFFSQGGARPGHPREHCSLTISL